MVGWQRTLHVSFLRTSLLQGIVNRLFITDNNQKKFDNRHKINVLKTPTTLTVYAVACTVILQLVRNLGGAQFFLFFRGHRVTLPLIRLVYIYFTWLYYEANKRICTKICLKV